MGKVSLREDTDPRFSNIENQVLLHQPGVNRYLLLSCDFSFTEIFSYEQTFIDRETTRSTNLLASSSAVSWSMPHVSIKIIEPHLHGSKFQKSYHCILKCCNRNSKHIDFVLQHKHGECYEQSPKIYTMIL